MTDIAGLVISIGTLVKNLYTYGKDVKDAQNDRLELWRELCTFQGFLLGYQDRHGPRVPQGPLSDALDGVQEVLQTDILNKIQANSILQPSNIQLRQSLSWPFKKANIAKILDRLERAKATMEMCMVADLQADVTHLKDDMATVRMSLQQKATEQEKKATNAARQALLNRLSPASPTLVHQRAYAVWRSSPSGSWFLNGMFRTWLQEPFEDKRIMLLWGISGAGKSTLISAAIETAKTMPDGPSVAFMYCTLNDAASRRVLSILGAWVVQLSSIRPEILKGFENYDKGQDIPSSAYLDAIVTFAETSGPLLLILDAINENEQIAETVEKLEHLAQRARNIRILVSSTLDVHTLFPEDSSVSTQVGMNQDNVQVDIAAYLRREIKVHRVLNRLPEDEVVAAILSKARGMFRFASCQMAILAKKRTPETIRKALAQLPNTLFDTYVTLLSVIPADDQEFVREALLWLSVSLRPMTLSELMDGVVCEDESEDDWTISPDYRIEPQSSLVAMCQGLVVWDVRADTVSLAHSSVRDFIQSEAILQSPMRFYHADAAAATSRVVRKCLRYLLMSPFRCGYCSPDVLDGMYARYPLIDYASVMWSSHARAAFLMPNGLGQEEIKLIMTLLYAHKTDINGGRFVFWIRCLIPEASQRVILNAHPLYYSASGGLTEIVRLIINSGHLDSTDGPGSWYIDHKCGRAFSTAMCVACCRGHEDVVRLLLAAGASPNATAWNGLTILDFAVIYRHKEIVRLLKDAGARLSSEVGRELDPEVRAEVVGSLAGSLYSGRAALELVKRRQRLQTRE